MSWLFYLAFAGLLAPFLLLAAVMGMAFTLALMFVFPSPRTRDVHRRSSFSIAGIYVLLRGVAARAAGASRRDAAGRDDRGYLQAPMARYLPSWWMTRTRRAFVAGVCSNRAAAGLLLAAAAAAYAALLAFAGELMPLATAGRRKGAACAARSRSRRPWSTASRAGSGCRTRSRPSTGKTAPLLLDVAHWSQTVLVAALNPRVYLFSIQHLPLTSPDLRSLLLL